MLRQQRYWTQIPRLFGLDCELLRAQTFVNCRRRRICVVKRLTVSLLGSSVFTPTVFAQSLECVEQVEHRPRRFSGCLEMVKGAERDYRNKNGRYGDQVARRTAH